MAEHLFITSNHFPMCHEYRSFGVGKRAVNQLSLVYPGDIVYFLDTYMGIFIGPYTVDSEPHYDISPVWGKSAKYGKKENYPFRVNLSYEKLYIITYDEFAKLVDMENLRIDSIDIRQRSILTIFPKDKYIIFNYLLTHGRTFNKNHHKKLDSYKENISPAILKHIPLTEYLLEYFILRNKLYTSLSTLHRAPFTKIYNQFRINLRDTKIDILLLSELQIAILELKIRPLTRKDVLQQMEYIRWVTDNRDLLSKLFCLNLQKSKVHGFLIGQNSQKNNEQLIENGFITLLDFEIVDTKLQITHYV